MGLSAILKTKLKGRKLRCMAGDMGLVFWHRCLVVDRFSLSISLESPHVTKLGLGLTGHV